MDPARLVVGQRVDKLVGLVHLALGLLCLLLQGVLTRHLRVELLAEGCLVRIYFSELVGGRFQLGFGFLELNSTFLEEQELGLHNL